MQLLYVYGMVFDNNPHAIIGYQIKNLFTLFSFRQLELCKVIKCLDPEYYKDGDAYKTIKEPSKI